MKSYKKLKRYMNDYCVNKSKLAKKINKSSSWMTDILSGKINLKVEDYKKICNAMGTDWFTVETYLRGENEGNRGKKENRL